MVKLSPEQTIILIRLIKKYNYLWNPESPLYKKKEQHQSTYNKIGSYFKTTGIEIKQKFRRLRGTYRLELAKLSDSGKTHSTLFYFDEMDFLRKIVSEKKPIQRNQCISECETNGSSISPETETEYVTEELIELEENSGRDDPKYLLINEQETEDRLLNESTNSADIIDQRHDSIDSETLDNGKLIQGANGDAQENCSNISQNSNEIRTKDEFDCFGTYIASQLRILDTISAMELMTELQKLIALKRINILERQNNHNVRSHKKISFNKKIRS